LALGSAWSFQGAKSKLVSYFHCSYFDYSLMLRCANGRALVSGMAAEWQQMAGQRSAL
jgi:hypothetical protein